jgi:hypothetical protein
MEVYKFVDFGCQEKTNSSINLISVNLQSSKRWQKAIIYDTVSEQIISEIVNNYDNSCYHIYEKYNYNNGEVYLMINNISVTKPSKLYICRYIIKIITNKTTKIDNDYIQKSNQYIPLHLSFV